MVHFNDKVSTDRVLDLHTKEEERYVQTMATQLGIDYINLSGYTINPEAIAAIPETEARAFEVAGFELKQQALSIAVRDPNHPQLAVLLSTLERRRFQVKIYMTSRFSLEHAWTRYKDLVTTTAKKKGVFEISPEDITRFARAIGQKDDVPKLFTSIKSVDNSRRVTEILELIFAGALSLKASDIHIEPEETVVRLRYRLDGVLHDIFDLDSYVHGRMMSRLKLLSGMLLNQRQSAQDGRFTFNTGEREIEVRASVIPGAVGESIVMRLLDPSVASFSMEKLELNPEIEAAMKIELKKPNGLIITTGPTGSGKTTALYAFLRETHQEGVKIITIENPVEYKLEGIVQTQTGEDYTFASGLRAVLRQDPDIIMVGEIRDREVAETAIHAAQTGHLVFSTLHTNSAVAGFARLMDLGIDPRIMGSAINIIIGQRLVRVLCTVCKQSRPATQDEHALITHTLETHPKPPPIPEPLHIYEAVGCKNCGGTGYKGRAGIFEGVIVDEAVEEAVLRDPREHIILAAAKPQGIPTMIEDGIAKIVKGVTSLTELERVIELPRYLYQKESTDNPIPETDFSAHIVH